VRGGRFTGRARQGAASAVLFLGLLLFSGSATWAFPTGHLGAASTNGWCGYSSTSDWACRGVGSSSTDEEPLGSLARRLSPRTTISTAAGSSARLTLKRQARCTIGGPSPSEAITRPGEEVVLRQKSGQSTCSADHGTVPIHLCIETECQRVATVTADGTVLGRILPTTDTAIASTSEVVRHRIRIVSCSGLVTVGAGTQLASGEPRAHNRFVFEVVETLERTEGEQSEETMTETAEGGTTTTESSAEAGATSSSTLTIVEIGELNGRGPCTAPAIREGERSVGS
jgi:hypothetical protein